MPVNDLLPVLVLPLLAKYIHYLYFRLCMMLYMTGDGKDGPTWMDDGLLLSIGCLPIWLQCARKADERGISCKLLPIQAYQRRAASSAQAKLSEVAFFLQFMPLN